MNIVLVNPEIPQNTGTIARLCAVTDAKLKLVHPLGFKTDDKHLRRAGLDYWASVDIEEIPSVDSFLKFRKEKEVLGKRFFYLSKFGKNNYAEVEYKDSDYIVFGSETSGLNMDILKPAKKSVLRIPMIEGQRCLNLANAASIVLYEALRQTGFKKLV